MLIIGLLLIAVALLVGAAILLDATERQTVEVFGVSVDTTDAGVFVAGAVTMLTLLIGVWITQLALARARRRRAEMKSLKRDRTESVSRLEEEKAELAAQLERERVAREAADRDSRHSPSGAARPVSTQSRLDHGDSGKPDPRSDSGHSDSGRSDSGHSDSGRSDSGLSRSGHADADRTSHVGTHDGVTGATAADDRDHRGSDSLPGSSEPRHDSRGGGLKGLFGKGDSSSHDDGPGQHEQRDGGAGLTKR